VNIRGCIIVFIMRRLWMVGTIREESRE